MATPEPAVQNEGLVRGIASANTQFGLDVYKKLAIEQQGSNLFFSPFSISAALAMTHIGARGETASQMSQVLKWSQLLESVHPGFQDYLSLLRGSKNNYVLKTANRLFINKQRKILDEFLSLTDKHYAAKAVLADFAGNGHGEARNINEWVESETNGKIKDLISGGIDPLTAMILINAIYFKGNWSEKFDPSRTSKGRFKVRPGVEVDADMMRIQRKFMFGQSNHLKCSILELPYIDKELSMLFLLPFKDDGLTELEKNINHDSLSDALGQLRNVTVEVTMPKFVLESSFKLNDALRALGMTHAFDKTAADLSGIDGTRLLYISEVVHKAFLEVNEEGSEAAAATAVRILARSLPIIEPFKADHPFLFLIRDNRANIVLFMGRLVQPQTANAQTSQKVEL